MLNSAANSADQIELNPPDFLIGPSIARTATGNTYSYRAKELGGRVALHITFVAIPPSLAAPAPKICADAFLAELAKRGDNPFTQRDTRALIVGPFALDSWRWTQNTTQGGMLTGVVGCGLHQRQFIAVTFEDTVQHASTSFPPLRASLATLRLQ